MGLISLLKQGLSEFEYIGDFVFKFRTNVKRNDLLDQLRKKKKKRISISNKEPDTTRILCDRLHAWWLTQSQFTTLQPSLIVRRWVGHQTLWRLRPQTFKLVGVSCSIFGLHLDPTVGFMLLQRFCVGLAVEYSSCLISGLNLDLYVCCLNPLRKVDKKATIRNRYNRIPHPALTPNGKRTPTIKTALN